MVREKRGIPARGKDMFIECDASGGRRRYTFTIKDIEMPVHEGPYR